LLPVVIRRSWRLHLPGKASRAVTFALASGKCPRKKRAYKATPSVSFWPEMKGCDRATGAVQVGYPVAACNPDILGCHPNGNGTFSVTLDSRIQQLTQSLSDCVVTVGTLTRCYRQYLYVDTNWFLTISPVNGSPRLP
jgi:hypothetical protein